MIFTSSTSNDFELEFEELLSRGKMDIENVSGIVNSIINDIKKTTDKIVV